MHLVPNALAGFCMMMGSTAPTRMARLLNITMMGVLTPCRPMSDAFAQPHVFREVQRAHIPNALAEAA